MIFLKKPGGFILTRPEKTRCVYNRDTEHIFIGERQTDRKDPRWNETMDIAPGLRS